MSSINRVDSENHYDKYESKAKQLQQPLLNEDVC